MLHVGLWAEDGGGVDAEAGVDDDLEVRAVGAPPHLPGASQRLRVRLCGASDHRAGVEQEAGEHGVGVEDGLGGQELQQVQAPHAPLLYHLRILAVEILGGQKLRELAVEVELLVDQGQLLKKLLELGKPEQIILLFFWYVKCN